jgi:hypothetical protein
MDVKWQIKIFSKIEAKLQVEVTFFKSRCSWLLADRKNICIIYGGVKNNEY